MSSYQAEYQAALRRYRRKVRRLRYRRSFSSREMAAAATLGLVLAAAGSAGVAVKVHDHHHTPPGAVLLAKSAVAYAHHQLGKPYIWGGTGPTGYDCSGLTLMAWQHAGVTIPRTSEEQWAGLHHVAKLKPGDLVFSYWPGDGQASPNHVQIYAGGGWVIGADTTTVERVRLSTNAGHIVGYADPAAGEATSANRALGLKMAAGAGLDTQQRHCLDLLWTRESGWQARVWNSAGSGAYGIPQALPASKMAAAGPDWRTNPATQIRWGLGYIKGRYTTPCSAWAHETSNGWY